MVVKLRIFIVSNSRSGGGAERASNLLSSLLIQHELDVVQVFVNKGAPDLAESLCPYISFDRIKSRNPLSVILIGIKFRRLVKKQKVDLLILNCELPEFLGIFVSRKVKKIVVEHADPSWRGRQILGLFVRNILESFHKVKFVSVSSHISVFAVRTPNVHVIPNLVKLPQELNLVNSQLKRLVYVGRLNSDVKRTSLAIEIGQHLQVPLLLIGDGPLAKQLNLSPFETRGNISWIPWTTNPWNCFSEGDLLCIPSLSEGDGLVVIEAISAGVPFVLSDIRAFRRLDLPTHHYFTNAKDASKKILEFKNNTMNFKVSNEMKEKLLRERQPNDILSKWQSLINEIH